jgi:major type 1 subunit fimbrin (pilin)
LLYLHDFLKDDKFMRKINLAFCGIALGLVSAAATAAVDGTVTFNGKLINETCRVDSGSENIVVTLPTVSTTKLNAAGQQTGSTAFYINVTDCPAEVTKVAAHFEAINSTGYNSETGNLVNSAPDAAASNVEVRLYNVDDGSTIRVGETGKPFDVNFAGGVPGSATLSYAGGYYATQATTAGNVMAQVQYVLAYN